MLCFRLADANDEETDGDDNQALVPDKEWSRNKELKIYPFIIVPLKKSLKK
jgi:hypothetical protein